MKILVWHAEKQRFLTISTKLAISSFPCRFAQKRDEVFPKLEGSKNSSGVPYLKLTFNYIMNNDV